MNPAVIQCLMILLLVIR
uniref:Uncharacterized protein n=1 Tax=Arundo donax TaxID=35708 RepID=A0A0A8YQD1_ARUDO